jgi:hypothetical protein
MFERCGDFRINNNIMRNKKLLAGRDEVYKGRIEINAVPLAQLSVFPIIRLCVSTEQLKSECWGSEGGEHSVFVFLDCDVVRTPT